jgi:hypothetical protein
MPEPGPIYPCGGNILVHAEGNIYVKGELRVSRLEDGRIKVVQNTREGVEGRGNVLAGNFEGRGNMGGIQQKEIIFQDLDTALRELANLKGIIPSGAEVNKINSLELGTNTTNLSGNYKSSKFEVTGSDGKKSTRWVQDIENMTKMSTVQTISYVAQQAATGLASLGITSLKKDLDLFATFGMVNDLGLRTDLRIESEKSPEDDSYHLKPGSKVDFTFSAKDLADIRALPPEQREGAINARAALLIVNLYENFKKAGIGQDKEINVNIDLLQIGDTIRNSLKAAVNNDEVLAKIVTQSKDQGVFTTGSIGSVLSGKMGDGELSKNVVDLAENTVIASVSTALEAQDIGFGVSINKENREGFTLSIPLQQTENGDLEAGTAKIGIKTVDKEEVRFKASKFIPFLEVHAGRAKEKTTMQVFSQVPQE